MPELHIDLRKGVMPVKCPDCGKELDTVIVKVRSSKPFYTDNERQLLIPTPNHDWEYGNYCSHCPHCDSLKVNELPRDYELEDGYRNLI